MTLERHGEQVFLLQKPHRFTAGKDAAVNRAVALTFGPSVLETAQIESFREDSAVLIDVTNWFVSDLSGIGQRVRFAAATAPGQPPPVPFDRQRSYLESVKASRRTPTFAPGSRSGRPSRWTSRRSPTGASSRSSVHYTLAALPGRAHDAAIRR